MTCQKMFDSDWMHAVVLLIKDKVVALTDDEFIDIRTGSGIFKLPQHIMLKKYVYIPYRDASPCRQNVFKRDTSTCQYCSVKVNKELLTIDHVIPKSRGGKHEWNNIVTCCLNCNRKKGNRTPKEANMPLLATPKSLKFGG